MILDEMRGYETGGVIPLRENRRYRIRMFIGDGVVSVDVWDKYEKDKYYISVEIYNNKIIKITRYEIGEKDGEYFYIREQGLWYIQGFTYPRQIYNMNNGYHNVGLNNDT